MVNEIPQGPSPNRSPDTLSQLVADAEFRQSVAYSLKKLADAMEHWQGSMADAEARAAALALRRAEIDAQKIALDDGNSGRELRYAFKLLVAAMILVIGPTIFLAETGKLSAEAVAFILGGVMGSAFTFISRFFNTE